MATLYCPEYVLNEALLILGVWVGGRGVWVGGWVGANFEKTT